MDEALTYLGVPAWWMLVEFDAPDILEAEPTSPAWSRVWALVALAHWTAAKRATSVAVPV